MSRAPIDIDACARTLVARMAARQAAAGERARSLRAQAETAARVLASEFGARRTWLFGSLAWGEPHPGSDVDLLVEGLPPSSAGAAERRVAEIIESPVDLVRIEEAPEGLPERVRQEGRLLHDAG